MTSPSSPVSPGNSVTENSMDGAKSHAPLLPEGPGESTRLADHTTFRIGGPADHLIVALTETELTDAVRSADQEGHPLLILSGGSNMLVSDAGFPGTVVRVATRGIQATVDDTHVHLRIAAGESWDGLVEQSVVAGWSGIETLSGIPGLVGAAPIQNIGAYGTEVARVITTVRVLDRVTGSIIPLSPSQCSFAYRASAFKHTPHRYVVLDVGLRLAIDTLSAPLRYAELARRLGVDEGARVPLADVRQGVLGLRRNKGMVMDPLDHDTWSSGSFFTNPVIGATQAASLPEDAPAFPQPDGQVKTSAAWLIDHAGFHKGFGTPPATLSTKHVLALTNRGGATAEEIITLARVIRDGVQTTFGILLHPEPTLVGLSL